MNDMRMHLIFFGLAIALCACTQNVPFGLGAPILDSHFGEAVTRARAMQTINPDGVAVNDEGYSGKAARNAMDQYERGRPASAPMPQAVQMLPAMPATPPR
jgi:hypothetical protein